MTTPSAVLITGASSGIGATYAERFARRGHDLVLVARDKARLDTLALRLCQEYGVGVDVMQADLTRADDLLAVEARLRDDTRIDTLINNAGIGQSGEFTTQTPATIDALITLNVTALTRLASAVAPRFAQAGSGSIVNIGSVVGLAPEFGMTVYGATKAFVLAVLPAGTYTEIWDRAGIDITAAAQMMEVGELVDAALHGFDRREGITIPPLHNAERWETLDTARQSLFIDLKQHEAAERYKTVR
jgi:short-subunit dehydrogenase